VIGRMQSVSVNGIPVLRANPETADAVLVTGSVVMVGKGLDDGGVWDCDLHSVYISEDRGPSDPEISGSIFLVENEVLVEAVGVLVLLSSPLVVP
jgi:hypothetical protein